MKEWDIERENEPTEKKKKKMAVIDNLCKYRVGVWHINSENVVYRIRCEESEMTLALDKRVEQINSIHFEREYCSAWDNHFDATSSWGQN